MRIALIRLGGGRHQLVWGCHHLVLDGWSVPIMLGELLEAYQAYRAGQEPPRREHRPFRDFVAWLSGRDKEEAARYWRERLAGVTEPTPLGVDRATGESGQEEFPFGLPGGVTAALGEVARRHRLTMNTVVLGAWAVLLSVYGGTDDVVFGVTTSGRGDQLAGMESMVGLLINTTPARVRVDPGEAVASAGCGGCRESRPRPRVRAHAAGGHPGLQRDPGRTARSSTASLCSRTIRLETALVRRAPTGLTITDRTMPQSASWSCAETWPVRKSAIRSAWSFPLGENSTSPSPVTGPVSIGLLSSGWRGIWGWCWRVSRGMRAGGWRGWRW